MQVQRKSVNDVIILRSYVTHPILNIWTFVTKKNCYEKGTYRFGL
jgi:hypothetical protein